VQESNQTRTGIAACLLLVSLLLSGFSHAQQASSVIATDVSRPLNFGLLRDEENWTALRDLTIPHDALDKLKYIPLHSSDPESFIVIGGEAREWFEHFDNEGWGTIPGGDNYALQRYRAHADVHLSSRFRVFVQLKSGLEDGRKVGPRPFDLDRLDLNQGYLDVNFGVKANTSAQNRASVQIGTPSGDNLHPLMIVRLGRQELNYGSGRLVSASEGVNVRFGFDGARVILQPASWRIDIFYVKPDGYSPGFFDDKPVSSQTLAGVYATTPLSRKSKASIDLYYLGSNFKFAQFVQGTGRDHRHSIGTRLSNLNPDSAWNYDVETTLQFGTFKPVPAALAGDILAWGISPFVSYGFPKTNLQPRFGFNAGATSGDKSPTDGRLQSFSSIFSRDDYFGESDQIGPVNVVSIQPEFGLSLTHGFTAVVDRTFLWRQSARDGLYSPAAMPVRSVGSSNSKYVGAAPEIRMTWQSSRRVSWNVIYQRYQVGEYLRQEPPGGMNLNYVNTYLTLKF
jgi:hypothetical protein